MNTSFSYYCQNRQLVENDGHSYTDTLAANYYHGDDEMLGRLAQSNPRMHRKYAAKLEKLKAAEASAAKGLNQAKHQVTMYEAELRRISAQKQELSFKLSQKVTDHGYGVPSAGAGRQGLQTMPPEEMDRMDSRSPLPQDSPMHPPIPGEGPHGDHYGAGRYGQDPTQYYSHSEIETDRMGGGTLRHRHRPLN